MHPSDASFYARFPILSEAELFHYIEHYADYKVEAVHAAIAELHTRGVPVSPDTAAEIDRYFTRREQQLLRPFNLAPRYLRLLSYVLCTIGLCIAIVIYVTTSPPPPQPYDPFTSKKYLRDLEIYGGKINILAVELRQWFASLWHGKPLAYTIACLTLMLSSLLWFMGFPSASHHEPPADQPHAPSDPRS